MTQADSLLDERRLAWIFGSSRSGSTWLMEMLAGLDETVAIDDPHLGHHLGLWRPIPLAWAAAEADPELRTLRELKGEREGYFFADEYAHVWRPALRALIEARFAAQADASGVERPLVVVKEPGSQEAGLLRELFPASCLIFLLRDGRDVVDSWLSAYQNGSWAQEEGAFPLAEDSRESFIRWQASVWTKRAEVVEAAFLAHEPARRVLVRYEDLLAAPGRELERVCEAMGVPVGCDRLEQLADAHAFGAMPDGDKGELERTRRAKPGGWRERMSEREQAAMHEAMGETLVRLGYPIVSTPDREADMALA